MMAEMTPEQRARIHEVVLDLGDRLDAGRGHVGKGLTPDQVAETLQEAVSDMKEGYLPGSWYADVVALCDTVDALRTERESWRDSEESAIGKWRVAVKDMDALREQLREAEETLIHRDISRAQLATENRRLTDALREQTRRMNQILAHFPVPLLKDTSQGRYRGYRSSRVSGLTLKMARDDLRTALGALTEKEGESNV